MLRGDPDRTETEKRETYIQQEKSGTENWETVFFCIMLNVPEASPI